MSNRKIKGFFHHPKVVHSKQSGLIFSQKLSPEEIEKIKTRLIELKTEQVEGKRASLEALRADNRKLEEVTRNYEVTVKNER